MSLLSGVKYRFESTESASRKLKIYDGSLDTEYDQSCKSCLVLDAGVVLSCGVTVDVIKSIAISTTTKVLFLDAAPAKIVVQAFNAEGNQ